MHSKLILLEEKEDIFADLLKECLILHLDSFGRAL